MEWIIGYFVVGIIVTGILWKTLKINWSVEGTSTKALLMLSTPLWPLVIIFVVVIWLSD